MKKVDYELIEKKIMKLGLYDPNYHYLDGEFFDDKRISKLIDRYPKVKRFYKTPDEIILDYFAISKKFDDMCNDYDDYEFGYKELPNSKSLDECLDELDYYENVYNLAKSNLLALKIILDREKKKKDIVIEDEAKHLFKNITIISHNMYKN